MKNFRHSIVAIIAVAMISSLTAVQSADMTKEKEELTQRINSSAQEQNITIAQKDIDGSNKAVALNTSEPSQQPTSVPEVSAEEDQEDYLSEKEIEEINAEKSFYQLGYVKLTYGTLPVRPEPSDEAEAIDQLEHCSEVEIMENSEGWSKISYNEGKTGYVPSSYITTDKKEANQAAMQYDNYKKATVTINGDAVRLRAEATLNSDIIGELEDGTSVIVLWGEGEFIRVCYGNDYEEGYVIATALTLDGTWIEKSAVSQKQKEVADRKAAEAKEAREKEEREEREKKEKEEAQKKATSSPSSTSSSTSSSSSSSDNSSSSSSSSSKGQALVDTAKKYLGVRYVWGGTSPSGFDCSGLVQYVCNKNGISVSRTSRDQFHNGVAVSKSNLQPGDLVFFAKNGTIHHVGIYVGNGNMIHAPQTGDVVKISSINTPYRQSQYAGARRVY